LPYILLEIFLAMSIAGCGKGRMRKEFKEPYSQSNSMKKAGMVVHTGLAC
jgi:hypothetical protein